MFRRIMMLYKNILRFVFKIEITFSAALIIFIVFVMCWSVFQRYVLGRPMIWTHEANIMSFIWATMFAASAVHKSSEHIMIETIMYFVPEKAVEVINLITSIIILGLFIFLIRYLPVSIEVQNRSSTSALPINIPRGWYYSVSVYIAAIMMFITQIYFVISQVMLVAGIFQKNEIIITKKEIDITEEKI